MERVAALLAAVVIPLIGQLARASRRRRLVGRIRTYTQLAKEIEADTPESASELRAVSHEMILSLAASERTSLVRKFDPYSLFWIVTFSVPSFVGLYFAWGADDWWRWPVLILSSIWLLVLTIIGYETTWAKAEKQSKSSE